MIKVTQRGKICRTINFLTWFLIISCTARFQVSAATATPINEDPLYFSLAPSGPLPATPSSLLIQSPIYIDVPANAVLSVHLMRGDTLISTSTLTFQQAYFNQLQLPAVPVASFVPLGSSTSGGQPLPNTILTVGTADLTKVAAEPSSYRLLWRLSAGVISTPGSIIVTGPPAGFVVVDLKLSAVSAAKLVGDQKPGSVLFFNRYTSNASNPGREDSMINITNTSPMTDAQIRLFLVNGATCQTTEVQICLAAQESTSLLMSDLDPGVRGYVIAVATDLQGQPIQFNWLTGNVIIRQLASNNGVSYNSMLGAVAIAKRKEGTVNNVNGVAEMSFDDVNYDRLPGQIAFDSVPSQVSASNATTLSVYRPITDINGAVPGASVQITGWGRNAQGQIVPSTGNLSSACYSDVIMTTFRLQPTPISQLLPSGATTWFSASSNDLLPLMGAQFNSGDFNSGSNARPLSFSAEYKIRITVSGVTCPQ